MAALISINATTIIEALDSRNFSRHELYGRNIRFTVVELHEFLMINIRRGSLTG
jgi:hypothetical protein